MRTTISRGHSDHKGQYFALFNIHTCTDLIYVPFILFEGISKSILFNSVLNFAISSVFSMRNVIIWY